MTVLNHFAQAAAALLLIELLVFLMIFLAVAGGLAFGLRWVRGKTEWAFSKVNGYVDLGMRYFRRGLDYAALPVIKAAALAASVRATAESVRRRVQQVRASIGTNSATGTIAARPVPPDATLVAPLAEPVSEVHTP